METPPKKNPRHLVLPVASAVAPLGIPASTRLVDVWEALVKYHDELEIPGEEDAYTLWPEAMTRIEVVFIMLNLNQDCMPTSVTTFKGPRAISKIFYCAQDHYALVEARYVHEVTHALRYALTSLANSKESGKTWRVSTPEKPALTPQTKALYMMDIDNPHSGYLVEHDLLGGITVLLTGYTCTDEPGIPKELGFAMMVTVIKAETTNAPATHGGAPLGKPWKKLHLKNGESILYCGRIITRSEHICLP